MVVMVGGGVIVTVISGAVVTVLLPVVLSEG